MQKSKTQTIVLFPILPGVSSSFQNWIFFFLQKYEKGSSFGPFFYLGHLKKNEFQNIFIELESQFQYQLFDFDSTLYLKNWFFFNNIFCKKKKYINSIRLKTTRHFFLGRFSSSLFHIEFQNSFRKFLLPQGFYFERDLSYFKQSAEGTESLETKFQAFSICKKQKERSSINSTFFPTPSGRRDKSPSSMRPISANRGPKFSSKARGSRYVVLKRSERGLIGTSVANLDIYHISSEVEFNKKKRIKKKVSKSFCFLINHSLFSNNQMAEKKKLSTFLHSPYQSLLPSLENYVPAPSRFARELRTSGRRDKSQTVKDAARSPRIDIPASSGRKDKSPNSLGLIDPSFHFRSNTFVPQIKNFFFWKNKDNLTYSKQNSFFSKSTQVSLFPLDLKYQKIRIQFIPFESQSKNQKKLIFSKSSILKRFLWTKTKVYSLLFQKRLYKLFRYSEVNYYSGFIFFKPKITPLKTITSSKNFSFFKKVNEQSFTRIYGSHLRSSPSTAMRIDLFSESFGKNENKLKSIHQYFWPSTLLSQQKRNKSRTSIGEPVSSYQLATLVKTSLNSVPNSLRLVSATRGPKFSSEARGSRYEILERSERGRFLFMAPISNNKNKSILGERSEDDKKTFQIFIRSFMNYGTLYI
uniref:Uncharacterized protein n=1 Tax=Microrhizoidea pickettheapsiorum TaxID=2604950 RepID=A0A5B9RTN8_9CHLO|nr:hypothetical protein [Microrhizoidea pickettheapsiorum]QEG77675.1 hypothetical protein [Microrhizoidea pickettheapsiorum]